MKKILFALVLAVFAANSAMAASTSGITPSSLTAAGFDRLTESQKAEIIQRVAAAAAPAAQNTEETIDKIDKWAQVGANLGKGLAATAKELGIAVNEFASTPIGKIATALLVWHFMGVSIMHIVGAFLIWGIGLFSIRYIVQCSYPVKYTYDMEKKNIFGNHPILSKARSELSSEMMVVVVIAHLIVLGAGLVTMFTM